MTRMDWDRVRRETVHESDVLTPKQRARLRAKWQHAGRRARLDQEALREAERLLGCSPLTPDYHRPARYPRQRRR